MASPTASTDAKQKTGSSSVYNGTRGRCSSCGQHYRGKMVTIEQHLMLAVHLVASVLQTMAILAYKLTYLVELLSSTRNQ